MTPLSPPNAGGLPPEVRGLPAQGRDLPAQPGRRPGLARDLLILFVAFFAARIGFLLARPKFAFSFDVTSWAELARLLRTGVNPYATTTLVNWPPVWLGCLALVDRTASALGLHFQTVLFAFLIAVEAACLGLVCALARRFTGNLHRPVLLRGLALSVPAVFLTCQHGAFDAIVAFCVLLFVYFLTSSTLTRHGWPLACLALSLGILTKTVPIVLVPLLLAFPPPTPAARNLGLILLVVPTFAVTLAVYALAPEPVLHNVLLYRSNPTSFGLGGLAHLLAPHLDLRPLLRLYLGVFPLLILLAATGLALRLRPSAARSDRLILAAALLLLAIPTLSSAYGPQYLTWHLPLFTLAYVLIPDRALRQTLRLALVVATLTYVAEYLYFPSHGALAFWLSPSTTSLTTRLVDACEAPGVQTLIRLPHFLTSLAVLAIGLRALLLTPPSPSPSPSPPPGTATAKP